LSQESYEKINQGMRNFCDGVGNILVEGFHYLALFAIGGAIVWSAAIAFIHMFHSGQASINDILLLFIYLELGAMVGIYFKTNHMPVRFLIYVAVTALTRVLLGDIQGGHLPEFTQNGVGSVNQEILTITGAILLLAVANLIFRFSSYKYPTDRKED